MTHRTNTKTHQSTSITSFLPGSGLLWRASLSYKHYPSWVSGQIQLRLASWHSNTTYSTFAFLRSKSSLESVTWLQTTQKEPAECQDTSYWYLDHDISSMLPWWFYLLAPCVWSPEKNISSCLLFVSLWFVLFWSYLINCDKSYLNIKYAQVLINKHIASKSALFIGECCSFQPKHCKFNIELHSSPGSWSACLLQQQLWNHDNTGGSWAQLILISGEFHGTRQFLLVMLVHWGFGNTYII